MNPNEDITLCLTIGKRPDELRQTLASLLARAAFAHIVAINDFGDEATNRAFRETAPAHARLISLGRQVGHHRAVDEMYGHIETPYVLHCEDDWLFDAPVDIGAAIGMLQADARLSAVCLRHIGDMHLSAEETARLQTHSTPCGSWVSLAAVHSQWFGYTFNPHIAHTNTWRSLAPFAQFRKERHISRTLRKLGKNVGFLPQGACRHIGFESVANPPKPGWLARLARLAQARGLF